MVLVLHDITNLKKLENLRREFVANVSHELKTPITSIKGFAETLLDGAMNDKQTLTDFLNIISKESDRIETLVFDLLELSHVEQQTEIETEPVSLSEITQSTIQNGGTCGKLRFSPLWVFSVPLLAPFPFQNGWTMVETDVRFRIWCNPPCHHFIVCLDNQVLVTNASNPGDKPEFTST